ncbi:MAG: hypothetical protein PHO53_05555 [Actinomycetota bacterium]|nr:hypothetical protein [Actinomycetota bacterium]
MKVRRRFCFLITFLLVLSATLAVGCGEKEEVGNESEGRPEYVTAYQACQFTKPAANKWQKKNWVIHIKEDDPDGITQDGKSRIWEVFYFSPTPERSSQMLVIYNRGKVWPNCPTSNRGGDDGRKIYREQVPEDFRVDSPEAFTVALRNGGAQYMKDNPTAKPHVALRCKADYSAIKEEMPAPKYKWIWDVYFRAPQPGSEIFHVFVDGMTGDFIKKETKSSL